MNILNRVVQINKKYSSAYFRKGICYEKLKNYEKALEEYKKCQNLVPNDDQLSNCIAVCLVKLNKNEEALVEFSNTLRINPKNQFALQYKETLNKKKFN